MENDAYKVSQIRELRNTDLWVEQILYWRSHLDVFIEEYFGVILKDVQKIQARCFGNCDTQLFVQSRGFGKTWITALCSQAMGVLYPGSKVVVASSSAYQASLVLRKIDENFIRNENILREIDNVGHNAVQINNTRGVCRLRNGSMIESMAVTSLRGTRAKIVIIDEAPEVSKGVLDAVIRPLRNETRDICIQHGFKDYTSKMVSITSACLKSNYFYDIFVDTLRLMSHGDEKSFACALDYHAAVRAGISEESFFEKEKQSMPESKFAMEYGSIFIGAESNSIFPYDLTEKCRTLTEVETAMPIKSGTDYVISVDLATSGAKSADNAVITIIKLIELENGNYLKKVVYIRSFHGKRLDYLATEVRKLLVKFPNTIKVVFDHRGLGDAFPQFLAQPWIDPETRKEYPALVMDNERTTIHGAIPLLRPVMADNAVNRQMVTAVTIALEQRSVEFPVSSRFVITNMESRKADDAEDSRRFTTQEKAIFVEADALQIEMGNLIQRVTTAGTVYYDVAKTTQHKDRYSSLGMGIRYIGELEEERKKKIAQGDSNTVIGLVTHI